MTPVKLLRSAGLATRVLRLPLLAALAVGALVEAALLLKLERHLRRLDEIPPEHFDDPHL